MIVLWIADIAGCIGLIFVCHSTKWGFNNKLQSIFSIFVRYVIVAESHNKAIVVSVQSTGFYFRIDYIALFTRTVLFVFFNFYNDVIHVINLDLIGILRIAITGKVGRVIGATS